MKSAIFHGAGRRTAFHSLGPGATTSVGRNFTRSALRFRKRIMREIEFRFIDSLIYAAGKIASVYR